MLHRRRHDSSRTTKPAPQDPRFTPVGEHAKRVLRVRLPIPAPRRVLTGCVLALAGLLGSVTLAPGPALALSEGRVYELVSPAYKGGYGATTVTAVAPNGESIAFGSLGAFAGDPADNAVKNEYIARRSPSGWSSTPRPRLPRSFRTHQSWITRQRWNRQSVKASRDLTPSTRHTKAAPSSCCTARNWPIPQPVRTRVPSQSAGWQARQSYLYRWESRPSHVVFGVQKESYLLPEAKGTTYAQSTISRLPAVANSHCAS